MVDYTPMGGPDGGGGIDLGWNGPDLKTSRLCEGAFRQARPGAL